MIIVSSLTILIGLVFSKKQLEIYELNQENYDTHISTHPTTLTMYFAPWCGHCNSFKPEFEKLCQFLHTTTENITCARVDCTVSEEICQKADVKGYPTILRHQVNLTCPYLGDRGYDELLAWVTKSQGFSPLEEAELKSFVETNEYAIVGYFTDLTLPLTSLVTSPSCAFSKVNLAIVESPEIAKKYGFDVSNIMYVFKNGSVVNRITEVPDQAALSRQLFFATTPLLSEFTKSTSSLIFSDYVQSYLVLLYNSNKSDKVKYIDQITAVANTQYGRVRVFLVDTLDPESKSITEFFRIKETPKITFYDDTNGKFFHYSDEEASVEKINKFVEDCIAGKVPSIVKSEPITEGWEKGPVKKLVVDNFNTTFELFKVPHVVLFYAPWCGHCQKLKPTWNKLGEYFSELNNLIVIADVDHTENDIDGLTVTAYPTIYIFKSRHDYSVYEGGRSFDDIKNHLIDTFPDILAGITKTPVEEKPSKDEEKNADL